MTTENKANEAAAAAAVQHLVQTIGITEAQAQGLVKILGSDRPSLVREARIMKARESAAER